MRDFFGEHFPPYLLGLSRASLVAVACRLAGVAGLVAGPPHMNHEP